MLTHKQTIKCFSVAVITALTLAAMSAALTDLPLKQPNASASPTSSPSWFYTDWQYRKAHDLTNVQSALSFYSISAPSITISGNPSQRHTFQPVHSNTILEIDKIIDGNIRKYIAYDSDPAGTQIRLYYSNDTSGTWTPYSQNPILGPKANYYRWPSTTFVNGIFYMFLEDRTLGTLERWSSTDGIRYTFVENVMSGGSEYKNPFIWFNPNDNNWYLYSHGSYLAGTGESLKVRNAASLDSLKAAGDSAIIIKNAFLGSPTMMFYNGLYWLLAEIEVGTQWQVLAYYSTKSASSGFVEAMNSPFMTSDEMCPMLFLNPDQLKAYLFTIRNTNSCYAHTQEVYLSSAINPLSNDLSNYQINISVNYGNGISSGDTVYLNGHSQTDFSDVRFTYFDSSLNSEVECPYWIEQITPTVNATFWVKIPQISGAGTSTMYVYYGNSNAKTTSDGNSTFEFFDDFNGDLSKWTAVGGNWQVQNGTLNAQTSGFGQYIRANNFSFGNDSVHIKVKWISGTSFESGPLVRGQTPDEQNNGYIALQTTLSSDNREKIMMRQNGVSTKLAGQGTTNPSQNVWYSYLFKLYGNILKTSISPLYPTLLNATDNTFSSGSLCLYSWSSSTENVAYQNLFVTKCTNPEPTQTTWYDEETNPTPTPTPTPTYTPNPVPILTPTSTPQSVATSSNANTPQTNPPIASSPLPVSTKAPPTNSPTQPSAKQYSSSSPQPKPINTTSPLQPQTLTPTFKPNASFTPARPTAVPPNALSIAFMILVFILLSTPIFSKKWTKFSATQQTSA